MDSGSPYQWLREFRWDNNGGLNPFSLLLDCAKFVASGSIKNADIGLEYISHLASPDGDAVQRMVTYFSEALAFRIVKHLPGVYKAIKSSKSTSPASSHQILLQKYFFELCPFLKLAYLTTNRAIVESMEGERLVHIIDLHCSEPAQWIDLLMTLKKLPEGPPHLKITGIHEKKEVLDQMGFHLTSEAGKLDFPFQFYPIVSKLEDLDVDNLPVKSGEALAISSVLQLHSLLATDDETTTSSSSSSRNSPAGPMNLHHRVVHQQRTFAEWLEKDMINSSAYMSPDSALSPLSLSASPKMGMFLNSLRKLQPKLMVITEQESNLNGSNNLLERIEKALYFYSPLFDCLDSTVSRSSLERQKLESEMLGEEIKRIIACEGFERKERYEKLEKWIPRMEMAGFRKVPLSYYGMLQAKRVLQSYGLTKPKIEDLEMRDRNIVFHNSISRFRIKPNSLSQSKTSCKSKHPTPSNNCHFSHIFKHSVPPNDTQCASFVNPFSEGIIHHHQQSEVVLGLRSDGIHSLGPTHQPRAWAWAFRKGVVRHEGGSEGTWAFLWAYDSHGTWAWPIQDVVEEEVEVCGFLHAGCGG
ncbi:scarecrow-like protein 3 [Senna tora]|uniref:Scarecrow-like protein 3 n=1 Tax=Senna tora TaxID=362788 RepID=A0A834TNA0_9FABA|nr:scarecrow-like protein 3 [Senna tora]